MDDHWQAQCLLLHSIPSLSDQHLCQLLLHYGGPRQVCESDTRDWVGLGVPAGAAAAAQLALDRGGHPQAPLSLAEQGARLASCGATILAVSSADYPPLLRAIDDPPPFLYLRGQPALLARAQLAVVGARRASPAGLRAAGELAGEASRAGLVITSGLAIGIDGAAHEGAMAEGGATIAVMATGIDNIYPARHRRLAADIELSGCLLTEFPPGMPALRENFPRRNRIVTGLSLGTLVVEAALPSGSLISANSALEQNREVFTLPWAIYHRAGAGCLKLLREGAHLVLSADDILEQLGPVAGLQRDFLREPGGGLEPAGGLSSEQARLYELVGYEVILARDLVQLSALPVAAIMAGLSALELKGLVARCDGGYIRR